MPVAFPEHQETSIGYRGLCKAPPALGCPSFGRTYQRRNGFDSSNVLTAVKIAFLDHSYILLFSGFFVCGFHVSFAETHLPAYIIDEGLDPILGAWSIGFIGLFNIAGLFLSGMTGSLTRRIV